MKPLFTLLFAILSITTAFSQITEMTGRVVDAATGEGLAYASVSIYNRPEATYTNTDGSFSLKVPTNRITDTAYISSVGYPGTTVLLQNINHAVIKLTKMVYSIDEVAVTVKRKKRKTIVINPISREPKSYNRLTALGRWNDTIIGNNFLHNYYEQYALVYVPYDSIYAQYKYIKEIAMLQFLLYVDPSVDSEDRIFSFGRNDVWKLRIRVLKAEPNLLQTGLDGRNNHHPGEDILNENVIATVKDANYDLDLDLESKRKLESMSGFEKLEYIRQRRVNSLGNISINLEKYKIVFPKTGIYYGIEYVGPPLIYSFWLCKDNSLEEYFNWSLLNGSWHFNISLVKGNKVPGFLGKPAISLTLSE